MSLNNIDIVPDEMGVLCATLKKYNKNWTHYLHNPSSISTPSGDLLSNIRLIN